VTACGVFRRRVTASAALQCCVCHCVMLCSLHFVVPKATIINTKCLAVCMAWAGQKFSMSSACGATASPPSPSCQCQVSSNRLKSKNSMKSRCMLQFSGMAIMTTVNNAVITMRMKPCRMILEKLKADDRRPGRRDPAAPGQSRRSAAAPVLGVHARTHTQFLCELAGVLSDCVGCCCAVELIAARRRWASQKLLLLD
jgi:hypothetical protein